MTVAMDLNFEYVTDRKNKDGTFRYYFRRAGQPLVRLPNPKSPEFSAEYQKCLDWTAPAVVVSEGTFGWLCDQYMDSAEFKGKAPATQAARRRVILSMMVEPIDPKFPETFAMERSHKLTRRHVSALRDRKAVNPNAANERLKILAQVFKLAIARGWRDDNPARDVPKLSVKRGGHETATDDDLNAYMAYHKSGTAHLAMRLLMFSGVRVSDLRRLGRQHIQNGYLVFHTTKTGVRCDLPIPPDLLADLPRGNMTFLLTDHGKPFASDKAISQRVAKWFRQAAISGVTAHGVRKWLATKKAEDGWTEFQLMAWFGWQDPKEARPYVNAANRRRLVTEAVTRAEALR